MDRYAFRGAFTKSVPIGLIPGGLRIDVSLVGTVTEGPLTGDSITGTDTLLLRSDGVGQVDVREIITSEDRVVASLRFLGFIVPSRALPDLAALLAPDFEWPDQELPMHGASWFEYATEEVSAATTTVYGGRGAINIGAGTIHLAAVSLALPDQSTR